MNPTIRNILLKASARWYLTILLVVGVLLRIWDGTKASIWHDEGFTLMLAPMSPHEIIERTMRDVHPPLYYLVLHYWMRLFGDSVLAVRGLSMACLLVAVPLTYLLMRRLWDEPVARLAALFVTVGPFLVRYSQETRMYAMAGLIAIAATYVLVRALEHNRARWWVGYGVLLAAGMYTHYYFMFLILAHGLYLLTQTKGRRQGLRNPGWWGASAGAGLLFAPWVPTVLDQVSRVQGGFWIPKVSTTTLPGTIFQYFVLGLPPNTTKLIPIAFSLLIVAAMIWVYAKAGKRRPAVILLGAYTVVGPLLVFVLSFRRAIYVDRYFVYTAVAFYCLLAIAISQARSRLQSLLLSVVLLAFGVGIYVDHAAATHRMNVIGAYVTDHYQPGDYILSGELYTFFDFSYYNHTGSQTHLWSKSGVDGYGESSLIYDRSAEIVVRDLATIQPKSGFIWVVGKPGAKEYYDDVPTNWQPVGPKVEAEDSAVQEYRVLPRSSDQIAVQ